MKGGGEGRFVRTGAIKYHHHEPELLVSCLMILFPDMPAWRTLAERAIAVVLTGSGRDGSMGVQVIKKMGGTVIAQDAETSEFSGMPSAAVETGAVDFILPLEDIPSALVMLVMKGEPE
ncbi:MAG: hypothetical protein Kow0099_27080 [Candidatus Abyssubacteria bacterium]